MVTQAPSGAFLVFMTRPFALLLAASVLAPSLAAQSGPSALVPDTVLAPSGGPRIVLLSAPGEGVAALRLFVPFRESALEGGAGWLIKESGLERMRTLARPVGAEVAASRTPWGIAYSVVGAAADFEHLAYLLREAVAAPDVESPAFREALRRLREATARTLETPRGRITADLRAGLSPSTPPPEGTPGSVAAMEGADVRALWLRSHQATAMTLVVSAPMVPEVILAATRGMGAPEDAAAPSLEAPAPPEPRRAAPQALRTWFGQAWSGEPAQDPHGPVVAQLVAQHLRKASAGFESAVELWELSDRWVLAVVGASYGEDAAAMRRVVSGALLATRDALESSAVDGAASRVVGELLFGARTPAGLVSVVGRAMEAGGDPMAAARQVDALRGVDAESAQRFLDDLLARSAVRAEIRP